MLAALTVSLGSMVVGFSSAYTSPALVSMQDRNITSFDISDQEVSGKFSQIIDFLRANSSDCCKLLLRAMKIESQFATFDGLSLDCLICRQINFIVLILLA